LNYVLSNIHSSAVDGRRPVYLYTLLVFVIGSTGVAAAQSIPSLLFWRFFQSMGASLGPELGPAVIGDIFRLEERGRAMGVFFTVSPPLSMISDLDMASID
jgi:MFS family permease